jgi:DNA-binding MarR family transcriptional regulator
MVTQPAVQDNDLVVWTQLLAETLNAEILAGLRDEHPDLRYAHGFLFQRLLEGPRSVGEVAGELGVTSQAVSKAVRELEALGYVARTADPGDARVRRLALTDRGRAAVQAARDLRARINAELAAALGPTRAQAAALALRDAVEARGAMPDVRARRVRGAQGLTGEGR